MAIRKWDDTWKRMLKAEFLTHPCISMQKCDKIITGTKIILFSKLTNSNGSLPLLSPDPAPTLYELPAFQAKLCPDPIPMVQCRREAAAAPR